MAGPEDGAREAQWMSRFYGCDARAFDTLADRWWARLFGFFRRRGLGVEDAEDLALKVLVRLAATKDEARRSRRFDAERPLTPYLLTLARNAAIEKWRERRLESPGLPGPETPEPEPEGLSEQALADLFLCIEA